MNGYKISLVKYSGGNEVHYVKAKNEREARYEKAYKFMNPNKGIQFICVSRITKADAEKNNIKFEEV